MANADPAVQPLFPYAARYAHDGRSYSIAFTDFPASVAYGALGGDDPQTIAEDLFGVILDVAARSGQPLRPPLAVVAAADAFPVRCTDRLAAHLGDYGHALTLEEGRWTVTPATPTTENGP